MVLHTSPALKQCLWPCHIVFAAIPSSYRRLGRPAPPSDRRKPAEPLEPIRINQSCPDYLRIIFSPLLTNIAPRSSRLTTCPCGTDSSTHHGSSYSIPNTLACHEHCHRATLYGSRELTNTSRYDRQNVQSLTQILFSGQLFPKKVSVHCKRNSIVFQVDLMKIPNKSQSWLLFLQKTQKINIER